MKDWLEMPKKSPLITAARVCGCISLTGMLIFLAARFFALVVVATIAAEWSVQLEGEGLSSIILMILSDTLDLAAVVLIMLGVFICTRTLKIYAFGWLCLSVQTLLGCIIMPLTSSSYFTAEGVSAGEVVFHYILYILLVLCTAAVGLLFMGVDRLFPIRKWMIFAVTGIFTAAFILSVVLCHRTAAGTVMLCSHIPSVFEIVMCIIMLLPVTASAFFMAGALKRPE